MKLLTDNKIKSISKVVIATNFINLLAPNTALAFTNNKITPLNNLSSQLTELMPAKVATTPSPSNSNNETTHGKVTPWDNLSLQLTELIPAKTTTTPSPLNSNNQISPVNHVAAARAQFSSHKNRFETKIPDSLIERIINDEDHKINPEFQIYPEFQTPTKFWLKIYTQYSTKDIVIYDSKNMNHIYEVIDLRPIQEKSRNAVVFEILAEKKLKTTIAAYKKAFLSLSKNGSPEHPTREESNILKTLDSSSENPNWKELASSIKSMKGQRDPIVQGLLNGDEYFPMMEQLFIQAGIPVELTRLCLVESSFNIKAGSKVGAMGPWQIMPKVGHQYLKMSKEREIDERISPLKSSVAAAKLLKFNYKLLGSWILAVVAYNHGFKGLPRLHPQSYSFSKIAHLFHPADGKKQALGWASKNYYSEFLAILHASMYANEIYGDLPENSAHLPFQFERIAAQKSSLEFIKEKNISAKEFLDYNPDVRDLQKPLLPGMWVAFPGEKQNFEEFASSVLAPHKKSNTHLAKVTHSHTKKKGTKSHQHHVA